LRRSSSTSPNVECSADEEEEAEEADAEATEVDGVVAAVSAVDDTTDIEVAVGVGMEGGVVDDAEEEETPNFFCISKGKKK